MNIDGWFGMICLWTPNIVISNDGTRARGQWNVLSPHCMHVSPYPGDIKTNTAYWFIGRYDNEFIKIDGTWKILKNRIRSFARAPYDLGWVRQSDARRIMHAYEGCGSDPWQPAYHPDNVYSGRVHGVLFCQTKVSFRSNAMTMFNINKANYYADINEIQMLMASI